MVRTSGPGDHSYRTPRSGAFQSQHGEDRWLDEHFRSKSGGFFVEVGAYDGVVLSNTYFLEHERGWKGVLIEPDPAKAALCRKNRPDAITFECAAVSSDDIHSISFTQVQGGEVYSTTSLNDDHRRRLESYGLAYRTINVHARTLDSMLEEAQATPGMIDFVSIDVEEGELEVLKGFSIGRWKPRLVIVESNANQRKAEIRDYFVRNGYAFLHAILINDFYAPVFGGPVAARVTDHYRYRRAHKPDGAGRSWAVKARRLLDRHLLWRFKGR